MRGLVAVVRRRGRRVLAHSRTLRGVDDTGGGPVLAGRAAARFNLRLAVWYRVDGDPEWRRGTTANLSRSGVLFHASGVGAFPPQRRTDSDRYIDIVIELLKGAIPSHVHCRATVARVVEPGPGEDLGTVAVTVGDYILLAS